MHIDQDDLWVLRHLRAAWNGGDDLRQSERALCQEPGRAAGRVAAWAFGRAARLLDHAARRRIRLGDGLAPTADERALLAIARQIAEGDEDGAALSASWLMRKGAADDLIDALSPALASAYGKAAFRRQIAARA